MSTFSQMSNPILELTKKTYQMYKGCIQLSLLVGADSQELLSTFRKDEEMIDSLLQEIDKQLQSPQG